MEMGMLNAMNLIVAAAALYLNGETGQAADTWAFLERLIPCDQLAAAIQGFDQYGGAVMGGGLPGLVPRTSGHNNYNQDAAIHINSAWRRLLQVNRNSEAEVLDVFGRHIFGSNRWLTETAVCAEFGGAE
jgi:hypothetical protein